MFLLVRSKDMDDLQMETWKLNDQSLNHAAHEVSTRLRHHLKLIQAVNKIQPSVSLAVGGMPYLGPGGCP